MKKVININFQGGIVPIEESAFETLKKYTDSLRQHFAGEEGRDEIINDIEIRIAELFGERLKQGEACITDEDVNNIINSMGRPEDFDLDNEPQAQQTVYNTANGSQKRLYRDENHKILGGVCSGLGNYFGIDPVIVRIIAIICFSVVLIPYIILWIAVPSSATQVIGSPRRRLFRDTDNKLLGGVCSGLATYFSTSIWVPRIIFLIPFISLSFKWGHWGLFPHFPSFLSLSFSPAFTIAYIILWILVPEARTTADKLEMQGKPVDLNSIKETIQGDMEQFGKKTQKWGNDLSRSFQKKDSSEAPGEATTEVTSPVGGGQQFTAAAQPVAEPLNRSRKRSGIGEFLIVLLKIFIGIWIVGIIAGLFALGIAIIGLLPLKNFFLQGPIENTLVWTAFLCLIWVPVIGIVVWGIRKLTNSSKNKGIIRGTTLTLWVIGWVALFALVAFVGKDFHYREKVDQTNIPLLNSKVNKIVIADAPSSQDETDFDFYFQNILASADTLFIGNTRIKIEPADSDSFSVLVTRYSNGPTKSVAHDLAEKIAYGLKQVDSVVYLQKGIAINKTDKFRNQQLQYIIKVPVGKRILVKHSRSSDWVQISGWGVTTYDLNYNNDWNSDTEYIMTNEGLKSLNDDHNADDDGETIDTEELRRDSLDIIQQQQELNQKIKERQEKINRQKEELQKQLDELNKKQEQTSKPSPNRSASINLPGPVRLPFSLGAMILSRF